MLVIPISSRKRSAKEIAKRLPEDFKLTIMAYNNLLRKKCIIPLLKSNSKNFELYFQETAKYLSSYIINIGNIIIRKQNKYPDIMKDLAEYNSILLEDLEEQFDELENEDYHDSILYSLDILQQYIAMTMDPDLEEFLNKTEYVPSVNAMVYVMTCMSIFIYLFQHQQENKTITKLLHERLNKYTKELESYIETVEIESDPKQMKFFENTKSFR